MLIAAMTILVALAPLGAVITAGAASSRAGCDLPPPSDGPTRPGQPVTVPISPQGPQEYPDLTADQRRNAATITHVAIGRRLPSRAAVLAVAAALQESSLINVRSPDPHGSSGLFQMTPPAWGTRAQVNDPLYASSTWYAHLVRVRDWQTRMLADVDAEVEQPREDLRGRYARWERLAGDLVGATVDGRLPAGCADGGDGRPSGPSAPLPPGFRLPPGTPVPIRQAVAWALAQLGTNYQYGGDCVDSHGPMPAHWCDCSSLVQMSYRAGGITLPRTTYDQVIVGQPVLASAVAPGDLLFTPGSDGSAQRPGHVGMAIGSGLLIEAPHTGASVRLTRTSDWLDAANYHTHVIAIRRVL